MNYSGCKGCVHLCAKPQVCLLEDDLLPYYQKIKKADAVVGEHHSPLASEKYPGMILVVAYPNGL